MSAPQSARLLPGQTAAATDVPPPASVAVASCADAQLADHEWSSGAPAGETFSITLTPAEVLILRLVEAAQPTLSRDQIAGRAIGHYAARIGVPALARDGEFDLLAAPNFTRSEISRPGSGR